MTLFLGLGPAIVTAQSFSIPNDLDLLGVWGTASNDVWAAGEARQEDETVGLYHFDGETWTPGAISDALREQLFPDAPSDQLVFRSIAGNASNNIYAIVTRFDDDGRFVVRYDGTQWDIHGFISSEKFVASYVSTDTGAVYIGGRGVGGGNSIVRRALGAVDSQGDFTPTAPADTAFALVASGITFGNGVSAFSGAPGDPESIVAGDVFFATTNGLFAIDESTSTDAKSQPAIQGHESRLFQPHEVFAVANPDGDPDVFTADSFAVEAFKWDGSVLIPNGDAGIPPETSLGDAATGITVSRLAAYRTTMGDGSAGDVENVFAIDNEPGLNQVLQYDFASKAWTDVDLSLSPLNDLIVFPDGSYFAVGDNGTIITNFIAGSNRYVWDNTVETSGDNNFHGATGGPTNWLIGDTAERQPSLGSSGDYEINGGDVRLFEQAATVKTLQATGALSVENDLSITGGPSSVENLSLEADLTLGGLLTLTGENNFWTDQSVLGDGTLHVAGMLTMDAPSALLSLRATLETGGGAITSFANGTLDLENAGRLVILPGGLFTFDAATILDDTLPARFTNRGTVSKSGPGTGVIDVANFQNEAGATILVEQGTFSFAGAGQLAGILDTKAGATTRFQSAEVITGSVFGDPLTIQGEGPVQLESTGFQVGGGAATILQDNGEMGGLVIGVDTDVFGGGTLQVTPTGLLRFASNLLDEFPGQLVVDGTLRVESGTLELSKAVQSSGEVRLEGGELILHAPTGETVLLDGTAVNVDAGAKLTLAEGNTIIAGNTMLGGNGEVVLGEGVNIKIGDGSANATLISDLSVSPFVLGGASIEGSGSDTATWLQNRDLMVLDRGSLTDLVVVNGSPSATTALLKFRSGETNPLAGVLIDDVRITNELSGVIRQTRLVATSGGPLNVQNFGRYEIEDASLRSITGPLQFTNHDTGSEEAGRLEFSGNSEFDGDLHNQGILVVNEGAEVIIGNSLNFVPSLPDGIVINTGTWEVRNGLLQVAVSLGGEWGFAPLTGVGVASDVRLIGPTARLNPDTNPADTEVSFELHGRLRLENQAFHAPFGELFVSPLPPGLAWRNSLSVHATGALELFNATVVLPDVPDALLLNGGRILGTGKIIGNMLNLGDVAETVVLSPGSSPGTLEITGDFHNGPGGVLEIELGGLEAGFDYDQLIVGGTALFVEGSKIKITLIDPNPDDGIEEIFIPRTGDDFAFLVAQNIEVPAGMSLGDFVEFTNLPAGVDLNLDLVIVNGMTEVTLTTDSTLIPPVGPRIISHPRTMSATAGGMTSFSVAADGASDFTYQWRLNGVDIPGATGATYELASAQRFDAGEYTVIVTADGVSVESKVAQLSIEAPLPSDSRVLNLSTRGSAQTGEGVLIPGFVITGSESKRVLLRAVGPTLGLDPFNIPGVLSDPRMVLKRWNGSTYVDYAINNDWVDNTNAEDIITTGADLFAFALLDERDAALLLDLPAGQYTAVVDGVDGATGVSVVELYDADDSSVDAQLINISTRGVVGTGFDVMISGFVVSSEGPKTFLIRVVGPTLGDAPFNLSGVLADPKLELYRRQSGVETLLFTQDDWGDNPDAANTAATAASVFAFPLPDGSADAAFVVTLQPGIYTVVGSAADGTSTGIAVVEVYAVD